MILISISKVRAELFEFFYDLATKIVFGNNLFVGNPGVGLF